tara:strand:+ start:1709 stop:2080 length:372 start_codon:yes stop_codon:yes gene_type:complete
MHNDTVTHILEGRRQWTSDTLHQITHHIRLLYETDKDSARWGCKGFGIMLGEGLEEAGFYEVSKYKWESDWGCKVHFRALEKIDNVFYGENLRIFINDKAHEIKDIFPLWSILREVWKDENRA